MTFAASNVSPYSFTLRIGKTAEREDPAVGQRREVLADGSASSIIPSRRIRAVGAVAAEPSRRRSDRYLLLCTLQTLSRTSTIS